MFDFAKLCSEYEHLKFNELKAIAANDSLVIMPALASVEGDPIDTFVLLVATACGADGKLDLAEYKLFESITGISVEYEAVCAIIEEAKGRDAQEIIDSIVDAYGDISEDVKLHMVSFCLALCAANGNVNLKERQFIRRLLK